MGNLGNGIKKFLQNKNTVTILGVILSVVILYFAYNMRVKSAINPVTVPYALEQIKPGTQIKAKMVGTMQVPPSMIDDENVLTNQGDVIDKYSNADVVIPKGSLFFQRAVVEKEQLPANIILDYPKGYVLYNLSVNTETTYGNSVYPGNYIDIYLKAVNKIYDETQITADADKIMLGKLISNVKVLAVKDANGQPVFSDVEENRTPAMVIFALPEDYYILLKKAEYLRSYDSTLIPVPTNESLKDEPDELEISSDSLKEWINRVTVWDGE